MGQVAATIAAGTATSSAFNISENYVVTGFAFDAALSQTAITFTATVDGTNYLVVEDGASVGAIGITGAASTISMLTDTADIAAISPLKNFKVVLGGNNTGATTITAITQKVA